jgi:hypothetical protein
MYQDRTHDTTHSKNMSMVLKTHKAIMTKT